MFKRLLSLLLVLCCFAPLTVSADWLPEENPVGETLIVEDDSNIIQDNFDKEKETLPVETDEVIDMTKETYLDRCFKPFAILFGMGIAVFLGIELVKILLKAAKKGKGHEA